MKIALTSILLIISVCLFAQNEKAYHHLTYSQVGYDADFPKHAMLRSEKSDTFSEAMTFELCRIDNDKRVYKGVVSASKEK